jgi:hypothetical protein
MRKRSRRLMRKKTNKGEDKRTGPLMLSGKR